MSTPHALPTQAPAAVGPPHPPATRPLRPTVLLTVLALHAPLGVAMQSNRWIATTHAAATVVAMIWILASARTPGPLVQIAAYIVGAEVLWRQTQAVVPWELGKYLLMVIFTVGIIRFVGRTKRAGATWLFLLALLPACAVPFVKFGVIGGIEPTSFNVSGLVALGLGVLFLSQVAGPWSSMRPALWCLVAPVIATATLGAIGSLALDASDFTTESNFAAASGFGPNQVSAILGLGALCLLLLAIREDAFTPTFASIALAGWFLVQAALTFSRGGVMNVAAAMLAALPFLLRRRDTASRVLVLFLVIGLLGVLMVFPRLNTFTGGKLQTRYSNTQEADLRTRVARTEYEAFVDSLPLGLGVGEAEKILIDRRAIQAHTEYTRLLAEHGLFGVVAILCLLAMIVQAYRRQTIPWGRAWTAAFAAWTLVNMSHAATRIAAPSFTFALAMFTFVTEPDHVAAELP